jgi:hypothetical protein
VEEREGGGAGGPSFGPPFRIFKEMKKIFLNFKLFLGNPVAHPDYKKKS